MWEYGFENLDQVLRTSTARIDGNCVGAVVLPDYPIAAIRTGQLTDEGVLWEAEVAFAESAPDYAAANGRRWRASRSPAPSTTSISADAR